MEAKLAVLVQRCQTCSEIVALVFPSSFLGSHIGRILCLVCSHTSLGYRLRYDVRQERVDGRHGLKFPAHRVPLFTSKSLDDLYHVDAGTESKMGLILLVSKSEKLTNESASKENINLSIAASAV